MMPWRVRHASIHMAILARSATALILASCLAGVAVVADAADIRVERLDTQRLAFSRDERDDQRIVGLPYFDARGVVQWNKQPVSLPPADVCGKVSYIKGLLAAPRIDYWMCASGEAFIAGVAADGKLRWQRSLRMGSGTQPMNHRVIGVKPFGIVLDTLEVWSMQTGETVRAAPSRSVAPMPRPVPIYRFNYAGVFQPSTNEFFVFDPSGIHSGGRGGLLRLRADRLDKFVDAERHLMAPVSVEDLEVDLDGRFLLIAETWHFRGPNWVRWSVYDLTRGRRVFEEKFKNGGVYSEPRITLGPSGHVLFSYRNGMERVAVHYLIHQ